MTTVGILGTGRMGGSMARSLARAGFDLILYNRTAEKANELIREIRASGAIGSLSTASTPREAASRADICISMLADGNVVRALYEGPDGLIAGLRPGSVVADMSTVLPDTILGLEAAIRARNAGVLDAPVSGSVTLAQSGQLTIMAGGTDRDLERARPVLEALSSRIFHMGPLGSGAAMKLAVNLVVFALNQSLSEALVLAESAGIDRALGYDVLAASAIGAPYVQYKRTAFMEPETTPPAFSLELAEKDLTLIDRLGQMTSTPLPQSRANLEFMRQAKASQGAEADLSSVSVHLRAGSKSKRQQVASK
jgi:3-hydroxyisobutyrate dehydrogenase/2-hydroxy-3-oxopropionate reductase